MYSPILNIVLFTLVLYKTAEAAVDVYQPEDKPPEFANQIGCFLSSLQLVLKINVPYSPEDEDSCEQYVCNDEGVTQRFTCGVKEVSEDCEEIEGDKRLPYPKCCNIVRCPNEDGTYSDF